MKAKHLRAHVKAALAYAECSTATILQVGCIIVKDDRIISIGYNGTPPGWDNVCEHKVFFDKQGRQLMQPVLVTRPEVMHAELNALSKLARSTESGEGATAIVTTAPCFECAKVLYCAGISEVYYVEEYRKTDGIEFLQKCGITIEKVDTYEK
tara:strand:+ start:417 stop:875 length:459 start_codon:yes stop_codon:yes gene_type:complete